MASQLSRNAVGLDVKDDNAAVELSPRVSTESILAEYGETAYPSRGEEIAAVTEADAGCVPTS